MGSYSKKVVDKSVVDSFSCIGTTDYVFSIVNIHENDAGKMIEILEPLCSKYVYCVLKRRRRVLVSEKIGSPSLLILVT